ncbi:TldD/PmbA family protein [Caulobacter vibrioides]|uniref:TldD/PmbA family protein n=1 Tax=Caulobacter vibrioides TaxID=155892 RepID=UPI000BB51F27|nr:TldD/PmbA family protein [Caulobacter vibrioides]ATC23312.1 TldD/PmbA family protein [Caulobacter vibrioides]AZH11523.1 TldD/PmbA family protein [Caulobacter vibrioides]PLR13016.1 TldD/PmbA family protein [Caulobacter vibrioides]
MDDNLLHDVVAAARKAGADAAEAVFAERQSLSVSVRLGELEEVEREEARDLGLRVFIGQRSATVSGSDISSEARAKLIERAVAMARLAPEDPYASLAPQDRLAHGPFPDLDLIDAYEPSAQTLETQARIAEEHARAVKGVTNSDGGSATWSSSRWALVTSDGFHGAHAATGHSISASAIAGEGAGMERGGEGRSTRHFGDLPAAGDIGMEAGRQAVARLNPRKIASTTAPVIFENRLAMSLIGPLLGAISGPSIARGTSFLKDKLGQAIFAKGVNLLEDPHRVRGLGSAPFDDEGVATQARALIEDGVLTTWLLNTSAAKQLGLATTGHASRGLAGPSGVSTHNLTLQPGAQDLKGLMKDAGTGLVVTSMFGPSLNGNTGDWSVGCSGYWFENGESTGPVTEITVAGNLIDIYARLVPGSDLEFRGASNSPSLLVDALAIAGK